MKEMRTVLFWAIMHGVEVIL